MIADGLAGRRRRVALMAVFCAVVLSVLSQTTISVALPVIAAELKVPPSDAIWILTAFQLVLVSTLFPFSSLGEKLGYRRVFLAGLLVVGVGTVIASLATRLDVLVGARLLQAIGGSAVMAVNPALIRDIVPASALGRIIGLNAMLVAIVTALGPSLAAFVLSVASWHWLFGLDLVWVTLALVLGVVVLPRNAPVLTGPYDLVGAALSVLAFCLVFAGIGRLLADPVVALALLATGCVFGVLLVRQQRDRPSPLLPLDLLRMREVAFPVMASVSMFSAQMAALVALPFQFHDVLGKSLIETGAILTAWPIAVAVMAPVAGGLDRRVGSATLCTVGGVVMGASLCASALLPASAGTVPMVLAMLGCGVGFGCFQAPNARSMITATPRHRSGSAGGVQGTARLGGQTLGTTVAGLSFYALQHAPRHACMAVLLFAAGCAMAGGAVSAWRRLAAGGAAGR